MPYLTVEFVCWPVLAGHKLSVMTGRFGAAKPSPVTRELVLKKRFHTAKRESVPESLA
jgi:hypothetical protein